MNILVQITRFSNLQITSGQTIVVKVQVINIAKEHQLIKIGLSEINHLCYGLLNVYKKNENCFSGFWFDCAVWMGFQSKNWRNLDNYC